MLRATPELALKYLEVALDCDNLSGFISGDPMYALNSYDMYGGEERMTCYYADALYKKYNKGDVENFDKMVFDAFAEKLSSRYAKSLRDTLEVFKHMLICEENGTATFKIDRKPLFEMIKNNVLKNIEFYLVPPSNGNVPLIYYLMAFFVEVHRITGEWIIPEEELQNASNA